jgi:hypothetical protein
MATRTVDNPPERVFNRSPRKMQRPSLSERTHSLIKPPIQPDKYGINTFGEMDVTSTRDRLGIEVGNGVREFTSTTWLWIIIVPIAVWFIIILLIPSFVRTKPGHPNELDHSSVLLWTLVISLIIWILFFGFAKCKSC